MVSYELQLINYIRKYINGFASNSNISDLPSELQYDLIKSRINSSIPFLQFKEKKKPFYKKKDSLRIFSYVKLYEPPFFKKNGTF